MKKVNNIEYIKMLWKSKRSHGPDVETILFLPIAIAVESKRSVDVALDDIAQIIRYAEDKNYDSVILRLEKSPEESRSFNMLLNLIKEYGVGIVIGEDPHAPLSGSDDVLLRAQVRIRTSSLTRLCEGMQMVAMKAGSIEDLVEDLSFFRKFFRGE